MHLEVKKFLFDIQQAAGLLGRFAHNKTFDDYLEDPMLRSAVERQFEIVGEALNLIAKVDQNIAQRITGYKRMVAFRNILIHGYAQVDDRVVWDVLQENLPVLKGEIVKLLNELN